MDAMAIAERAMAIAADMCVYTNTNVVKDSLDSIETPPVSLPAAATAAATVIAVAA